MTSGRYSDSREKWVLKDKNNQEKHLKKSKQSNFKKAAKKQELGRGTYPYSIRQCIAMPLSFSI